jgi:predicted NBD/HSP70 family sugar kinase
MAVANRDLMRAINRFAILHAIRDVGAISRIDISRTTGLSQATVTSITADLLAEGMLLEQQSGKSVGGRRPIPLALNPQGAYTVGVHLSVDQICVVLMDLQAIIINSHSAPLDIDDLGLDSVVEKMIQAVHACLWDADFSKNQLSGIGVAIPGLIDSRTGFVHYIPNYQWQNVNLAELLRKKIGIPAYVENSANTLVIFEQWFGIGRGVDNFILITTENGIGMGMVVNGQIFRGFSGVAGEFGHTIVQENGPLCRCGEHGCLEAICGNNAIIRDAKEAARQGKWQPKRIESITIGEVLSAARQGNVALKDIYYRVGRALGTGISNLQKLLDPEKIIISGKGVLAEELIFGPMLETLHKDISFDSDARVRLFAQEWKATNYARGAGALVLQEVYESPANRVVPII